MTAYRLCAHCGQPAQRTPCPTCHTKRYGPNHRLERIIWQPFIDLGDQPCHRDPTHNIDPTQPWDLDHPDNGQPAQPSCAHHNRQATRGIQ